eukprot:CAMPEP_0175774828 /NCGR_PEP_ID=MMETSP0097-20121207/73807_1 /TAXON_ID=311494 /ORGANISM="Alexandrium monilatum, Strain CCMP3105" /LENGTH=68 /DNA_ID=CAMNT_0017085307 /DNA_START=73 /DNA_END=279 /DNA_ORIENTATION=+
MSSTPPELRWSAMYLPAWCEENHRRGRMTSCPTPAASVTLLRCRRAVPMGRMRSAAAQLQTPGILEVK